MNQEAYQNLCRDVWEHNRRYYIENAPTISDQEFDRLLYQLEQIEKQHPEWLSPSSPTQRVGEMLAEGFQTVEHKVPMLSLANTYSQQEVEAFVERMFKLTEHQQLRFSCELKMDGIAVSVHYRQGILTQAVTRGDGRKGDNITHNMRTLASLPLQLYGTDIPEELEVRGEVFMPIQAFEHLNEQRKREEKSLFANPRNAAGGSLKLLDPQITAERHLAVVFYGIAEGESLVAKQSEVPSFLKQLGLPTLDHFASCSSIEEIWAFIKKVEGLRASLPYQIDGVVIKLDDLYLQKAIGTTGKSPRSAVAYKFAAEQAKTTVESITVQVGRTGVCTPVAELSPVSVAGSMISRATLHNIEEVERKDVRIGDVVTIEKGGDVIPKVVEVDFSKREKGTTPWKMPTHCPSCGTLLEKQLEEVAVKCPNKARCPEQQLRKILHFASKDAMNIENLGEKIVEQLVVKGFVKKLSDLYALTEEQLFQLEGFKEKAVRRLLDSLEHSKKISLERFVMALGIPFVGKGTAELLAQKAGTIQALSEMEEEALIEIDGVGEKVASAVVQFFSDPIQLQEIERMLAFGVSPSIQKLVVSEGHPFYQKSFVLTGTLKMLNRGEAAQLIKSFGGKVVSAVSKKTHYLVAGESPGSKLEKATSLGVPILSEEEFLSMTQQS